MLKKVNVRSSVPVYMQIANEIQFAIASGELKAGDQLPTLRKLSERLATNFNTVVKAYRDLEVKGLIYSRQGMGVFVQQGAKASCRARCLTHAIERLYEMTQEAKAAGMKKGEIAAMLNKSYASKGSPYDEVPRSVLASTKTK